MEMVDTARRIRSAFDFGLYEVTFTGSQSGFSRFKQKNILMKYLSTKVLLLENSYSFSTKKMKEVRVNVVLSGVGEHMGMT